MSFRHHSPMLHRATRLMGAVVGMITLILALTAQSPIPSEMVPVPVEPIPYVTLEGLATLPADTFAPGPPAGNGIAGTIYERTAPFASQPVQGFSAILPNWNGNYLVLTDNGFGTKENSADCHLRWYEVALNFATQKVEVIGYTELRDPDGYVPWTITNESQRILTGADFDPEAFQQAPDGTFWIGDEFGPYLLHTDATGKLIESPYPLPYPAQFVSLSRGRPFIQTPNNAEFAWLPSEEREALSNVESSRGLEGLAMNPSGTKLYTMLEGALKDDVLQSRVIIQEFDLIHKTYTNNFWLYRLSSPDHAIGAISAISDDTFLVIERDRGQGEDALFKRIYSITINSAPSGTTLSKKLVADLVNIADTQFITRTDPNVVGFGPDFRAPFISIEGVYAIDDTTLLVINDNNYPFGTGRRMGVPDDNEFILLGLPETLGVRR